MEIRNAKIVKTKLGTEDHGIFTFWLDVDFDGGGVGIGGWALDEWDPAQKKRVFQSESMEIIQKILETVGVENWEDLSGKYIRIKSDGWGSTVEEIGNLMSEKWLNFRTFFEAYQKQK